MSQEATPNGAGAPQSPVAPAVPADGVAASATSAPAPAAAAAPAPSAQERKRGLRLSWRPALSWSAAGYVSLGGLCGGLVAAAALTLLGGSGRPVATLDLQSVIELQQLKLTAMVLRPGATDEDRAAAYTQVRAFGPALDQAIERLAASCSCTLITRAAVVGASKLDLTDKLKRDLGLDGASADAWRKLAGAGFGQALPSPEALRSSLEAMPGSAQGGRK
jgi:hypothetical protein